MTRDATDTRLRLRLLFPGGGMLGPGKADLLDGIARTGSISAAGREMRMSYKRAWTLVETMNATFRAPLVERSRGGTKGGGAELTELGQEVLDRYRRLEDIACREGAAEIAALSDLLGDMSEEK
ncbi:winged helix-turn-helix domain-containing protein [Psychromarinibacter halotolerans]|uniref:Winged helix-turn-helix domain-containing protein n=1 Tax=Psychromarinibacter halotolerans TaxID=1775175 RepID=A0ABV7GJZ3_9RHOB|nr:LysR family transcriptional regulator [Psychromarinibacter halotolerans]MDF0595639.1 LysR family transcriptional regulator [Psychromarinibacter halotolerans]